MKDAIDKITEAVAGIGRDCLDALKGLSGRVQVQRLETDELTESLKTIQGVVQAVANQTAAHLVEINRAAEKLSALDERVTSLEQQRLDTAGEKEPAQ